MRLALARHATLLRRHLAHHDDSLAEESLTLAEQRGNSGGIARAQHNLGWRAWERGDYAAARPLFARSLAIWRELDGRARAGQHPIP